MFFLLLSIKKYLTKVLSIYCCTTRRRQDDVYYDDYDDDGDYGTMCCEWQMTMVVKPMLLRSLVLVCTKCHRRHQRCRSCRCPAQSWAGWCRRRCRCVAIRDSFAELEFSRQTRLNGVQRWPIGSQTLAELFYRVISTNMIGPCKDDRAGKCQAKGCIVFCEPYIERGFI